MPAFVAKNAAASTNALPSSNAITPAVGDLLIAVVGYTTGTVDTATVTDDQTGGTYTKLGTATGGTANINTISIFARDVLCASTTSHTLTYSASGSTSGRLMSVHRWSGFSVAGASVLVKVNTNRTVTAAGTPAATMGSAIATANAVIGALINETNTAGLTEPTGYTEQSDLGHNSPTAGYQIVTRDSGETGSTVTWGSASASQFGVVVVELQASAGTTSTKAGTGAFGAAG